MPSQHTTPDRDDQLIDAIYQDGVLKPLAPLDLPDGTLLQIRLSPLATGDSVVDARSNAQADDGAPAAAEVPPLWPVFEVRRLLRNPLLRTAIIALALGCGYSAHSLAGDTPLSPHPSIAFFVWLLGIGLAVVGCLPTQSAPDAPKSEHTWAEQPWPSLEIIALVGLFIFALLVRSINIGSIPGALTGDEGSIGLMVAAITQGRFNNPFITAWFSFPSLFFAVPALFTSILGENFTALRIPSAIVGALTVVSLYWFGRVFFNRTVAAAGAAMLAALHFHIAFSRVGLNNIWDGLFGVLILGTFWRGWLSRRRGYFLACGILMGLSQYFYTSTRMIPLVLIGWLGIVLMTDWRRFRQRLPDLLSMALVALVVFMPLGLYYADHQDEFAAPMNRVSLLRRSGPDAKNWFDVTSESTGTPIWRLVINNYVDAAKGFVSLPLRYWYDSGRPLLLAAPAVLFLLGLASLLYNFKNPRTWLLVLLLLGMLSISALTESTPAAQRFVIIAPIATLLAGVGFATLPYYLERRWPQYRPVIYGFASVAIVTIMAIDLHFYFFDYAPERGQGDFNTQVASALGKQLNSFAPDSEVYFLGSPRMRYSSIPTVPFLAPQVKGIDVSDPLTALPNWQLTASRTLFVFVLERQHEATLVEQRYPGGTGTWVQGYNGKPLYYTYEVNLTKIKK